MPRLDHNARVNLFAATPQGGWRYLHDTTLGAFLGSNEFSQAEKDEVTGALLQRAEYIGGGGAAAGYRLNLVA